MDEKKLDTEELMSPESEDNDEDQVDKSRGCASSYLVEERENDKKTLPHKFRQRWTKAASLLALVSFIAAVGFSIASFITSQTTESSAVFAAGFDAFFAAINVIAVCWRFRDELNGEIGPMREKKATSVISITFIFGGIATIVIALYHLEIKDHPEKTGEMMIVLGVGFVIYTILALLQCYVAKMLESSSMKALSVDSALAAAMSIGLLGSAGIYSEVNKLWYLDHVVATVLGTVSLIYGIILGIEIIQFKIKEKIMLSFQKEFKKYEY